jgi:hypothetical protein
MQFYPTFNFTAVMSTFFVFRWFALIFLELILVSAKVSVGTHPGGGDIFYIAIPENGTVQAGSEFTIFVGYNISSTPVNNLLPFITRTTLTQSR